MPATYLNMIAGELESLPEPARLRVRVVGPRKRQDLPIALRSQWMPYDSRLQLLQGVAGTESDFPHRAVRHFAEHVLSANPEGSAAQHAATVDRLLGKRRYVRPMPGQRMTDDELLPVIRRVWREQNGNRSRALRELRTGLRLACEQSRFKRLVDQLEGEVGAARSS
jgi:hypothetical protein